MAGSSHRTQLLCLARPCHSTAPDRHGLSAGHPLERSLGGRRAQHVDLGLHCGRCTVSFPLAPGRQREVENQQPSAPGHRSRRDDSLRGPLDRTGRFVHEPPRDFRLSGTAPRDTRTMAKPLSKWRPTRRRSFARMVAKQPGNQPIWWHATMGRRPATVGRRKASLG